MGIFDFFTKKTPKSENERTYYPGGRTFGIKLIYDPDADRLSYIGRYSIRGSFKGADVTEVAVKAISSTHGVIMLHSGVAVVFTSDILPLTVCRAAQAWLLVRGEGYITKANGEVIKPEPTMEDAANGGIVASSDIPTSGDRAPRGETTATRHVALSHDMPVEASTSPVQDDPFETLKKLKELADLGIITAEEYEAKRQKLVDRI